jgi:hypothetical protein
VTVPLSPLLFFLSAVVIVLCTELHCFISQEQSHLSLVERNYGIPRLDQLEAMDRLRETRIDGATHTNGTFLLIFL